MKLIASIFFFLFATIRRVAAQNVTLIEAIAETGEFSTLLGLLEESGFASLLPTLGPLTIFSPTDAAIAADPAVADSLSDPPTFQATLSRHAVLGSVLTSDVLTATDCNDQITTIAGTTLKVSKADDGSLLINDVVPINGDLIDIQGTEGDGVLHGIDAFIPLSSFVPCSEAVSGIESAEPSAAPTTAPTTASTPAEVSGDSRVTPRYAKEALVAIAVSWVCFA